jgi:probable rRNA maturation factor
MADGDSSGRPSAFASGFGATRRSSRSERRRSGRPSLDVDIVLPADVRAPGLATWLQSVAPARARGSVTVALVSDARVRHLNRDYRKQDKNTDVLSFPAVDRGADLVRSARASLTAGSPPRVRGGVAWLAVQEGFLGDIVIAAGVARRQARDAGHSLQTELRILALHGLLHLLGYDHEHDDGQMERLERRLRRKGGLREGLIERAG